MYTSNCLNTNIKIKENEETKKTKRAGNKSRSFHKANVTFFQQRVFFWPRGSPRAQNKKNNKLALNKGNESRLNRAEPGAQGGIGIDQHARGVLGYLRHEAEDHKKQKL